MEATEPATTPPTVCFQTGQGNTCTYS